MLYRMAVFFLCYSHGHSPGNRDSPLAVCDGIAKIRCQAPLIWVECAARCVYTHCVVHLFFALCSVLLVLKRTANNACLLLKMEQARAGAPQRRKTRYRTCFSRPPT